MKRRRSNYDCCKKCLKTEGAHGCYCHTSCEFKGCSQPMGLRVFTQDGKFSERRCVDHISLRDFPIPGVKS